MNKKRALDQTKRRFTNLIDGTIKNNCTVSEVIAYYEGCLTNRKVITPRLGNIESNFQEDYNRDLEDEEEFMRWMEY